MLPLITQGVRCCFGEEVNRRRGVESVLAAIARNWGFRVAIPPSAGILVPEEILSSRRLIAGDAGDRCRSILVKPMDLPTHVGYGVAVAAICGRDVLLEIDPDLHQPLDLGFGRCTLVLAGRSGLSVSRSNVLSTARMAAKYPRITERYFRSRGLPVKAICLSGRVELAPNLGFADTVVDPVETGRTLRGNGLEVHERIAESGARLVVNRAGFHVRHAEIQELLGALRKMLE
ncbi:MAG: ATP phosphoribosyltransferase [Acidobacteria bacterium]|nr:ATP phosphoribosyltransferase [Acidobacteriota bacterium]